MTCRGYIRSTNTDNNLVEINEEMSELLDKQLWLPMNKGLTAKVGGNRKCAMKIKKEKNDCLSKIFLMTGTTCSECYTTVDQPMKMKLTTMKLHETKVLLVE